METNRKIMFWLALCLCLGLKAQVESHLTYRRYTIQDGLPQMQTERLWQDSRGYIYIGTLSGFVRFDGRSFTPFLKGRRENIVGFAETGGQVRALGFRRQWIIGTGDEVTMQPIDPQGHWQLNNLNAGSLPNGYALLEDEQEQNRQLCRITDEGVFHPVMRGAALDRMTPDRHLYMDSLTGLRIPHGNIYAYQRRDSVLYAFGSDGIYRVNGHVLQRVMAASWTEASFGLTVRSLHSGDMVIADEHTVYLYDQAGIHQVMTGINLIRDVLVDRWDRLWVATYQGVYCFFNRNFTNHRLLDDNDIVRALATDGADRLYMGTLNGKVLAEDGGWKVVSDDPAQYYGTSAVTIGPRVFMPCHSDVACIDASGPATLRLPQDRYRFLTKDSRGRLVLVSQKCVVSAYDPDNGKIDTLSADIPYPWCAAFDAEGRLWAGGTMGVFCLKDGQVEKADYAQRLLVTTMVADSAGTIFFASADSLFIIRKGQIAGLNDQLPQLSGHEIRSLHLSPRGYLVVAAIDGLLVCRVDEDYRLSRTHFFNHLNGFTLLEPLMATMAETSDGTVWLPGVEEMTSFRPADLLAYDEEDTYVPPLPRWWQHWWVWVLGLLLFAVAVWATTRAIEKRRNRKRMIRLQRQKLERERQIESIRQKAIEEAESTKLAKDIVKMTEKPMDNRLTLRTVNGTVVVDVNDIAYFKADGNYSQMVAFHVQDMVFMGLGAIEKMLNPETFVRADRSTLVNIHNISLLLPKQNRCIFRSASGQEVEARLLKPAFKRLQELL